MRVIEKSELEKNKENEGRHLNGMRGYVREDKENEEGHETPLFVCDCDCKRTSRIKREVSMALVH